MISCRSGTHFTIDDQELPCSQVVRSKAGHDSALPRMITFSILLKLLDRKVLTLDGVFTHAIARLGEFFEIDRVQLSAFTSDRAALQVTQTWAAPGIAPIPVGTSLGKELPWGFARLSQGRVYQFDQLADLPSEASVDQETFARAGTQSHLSIPFGAAGALSGVLTFGSIRQQQMWPDTFVDRLHVITDVFANALARQEAEHQLRTALADLNRLKNRLEIEHEYLRQEIESNVHVDGIVGQSSVLQHVLYQMTQVADTDSSVLILGETGTGKELIARGLHRQSSRHTHPLIKVNCAALPSTLIESELFGHERGAFTGALNAKIGRFELADGGTIFLDEIGDLPLELQPKLLRVLQEGEFERLGSTETTRVDVRVLAATNRNLEQMVQRGSFRSDLYYRLRVIPLESPPLRRRRDDIPLLVWSFIEAKQAHVGKRITTVPTETMEALVAYDWPGNIRELENVIERAVILSPGPVLVVDEVFSHGPSVQRPMPEAESLRAMERAYIVSTLERCGWRVKGVGNAAERLGLPPSTLRARMKKLGIRRPN